MITLFGVRPCNCCCVRSSAMTIASISATDKSNGNLIVKRIFPLNETGYSFSLSTKYLASNCVKATVAIEPS